MKIIATKKYNKLILGQLLEKENLDNNLPVIKEEDLYTILEDDIEIGNKIVPEGSPVTEHPLDTGEAEEVGEPLFSNKFSALDWAIDNNKTTNIN